MRLDEWIAACQRDAERRGLPELVTMLGTLADATRRLRSAGWNADPAGRDGRSEDRPLRSVNS